MAAREGEPLVAVGDVAKRRVKFQVGRVANQAVALVVNKLHHAVGWRWVARTAAHLEAGCVFRIPVGALQTGPMQYGSRGGKGRQRVLAGRLPVRPLTLVLSSATENTSVLSLVSSVALLRTLCRWRRVLFG